MRSSRGDGHAASKVDLWLLSVSAVPADVEGNEESATVVDLIPWTQYQFRVTATNTLGTGEPSSPSATERTMESGKSPALTLGPRR